MARLSLLFVLSCLNVFATGNDFSTVFSECFLPNSAICEKIPVGGLYQADEGREGVLVEPTDFWIGMPNKENSIVFLKLAEGTEVKVLDLVDEYFKIVHRSLIGYVEKQAVEIKEPVKVPSTWEETPQVPELTEKGAPENDKPAEPTSVKTQYTVTQATSLRAGPDHRTKVYVRLQEGTQVEVLESTGKWWWKVKYEGKVGWAKCALLKKN